MRSPRNPSSAGRVGEASTPPTVRKAEPCRSVDLSCSNATTNKYDVVDIWVEDGLYQTIQQITCPPGSRSGELVQMPSAQEVERASDTLRRQVICAFLRRNGISNSTPASDRKTPPSATQSPASAPVTPSTYAEANSPCRTYQKITIRPVGCSRFRVNFWADQSLSLCPDWRIIDSFLVRVRLLPSRSPAKSRG